MNSVFILEVDKRRPQRLLGSANSSKFQTQTFNYVTFQEEQTSIKIMIIILELFHSISTHSCIFFCVDDYKELYKDYKKQLDSQRLRSLRSYREPIEYRLDISR